mmetsp:Transcript_99037/g.288860  ORF Transcript_99037/g.288860 Transcript_99037/m.288860 type:complete len:233 (-) Transcript_99037:1670-2368(-)
MAPRRGAAGAEVEGARQAEADAGEHAPSGGALREAVDRGPERRSGLDAERGAHGLVCVFQTKLRRRALQGQRLHLAQLGGGLRGLRADAAAGPGPRDCRLGLQLCALPAWGHRRCPQRPREVSLCRGDARVPTRATRHGPNHRGSHPLLGRAGSALCLQVEEALRHEPAGRRRRGPLEGRGLQAGGPGRGLLPREPDEGQGGHPELRPEQPRRNPRLERLSPRSRAERHEEG